MVEAQQRCCGKIKVETKKHKREGENGSVLRIRVLSYWALIKGLHYDRTYLYQTS